MHGLTLKAYVTGFGLSLILTVAAFLLVTNHLLVGKTLLVVLGVLALTQLVVQLLFFLHLGGEQKPRWKLIAFWFMLMVLAIVVFGSLWIMDNLNYNMMHGTELDQHIIEDEGMGR